MLEDAGQATRLMHTNGIEEEATFCTAQWARWDALDAQTTACSFSTRLRDARTLNLEYRPTKARSSARL